MYLHKDWELFQEVVNSASAALVICFNAKIYEVNYSFNLTLQQYIVRTFRRYRHDRI